MRYDFVKSNEKKIIKKKTPDFSGVCIIFSFEFVWMVVAKDYQRK